MDNNEFTMAALNSLNNSLANSANVIMAAQTSRADRKFSREMSDLAWQRNIEAWNMQNEYNLPSNVYARQLEGLQANGLNPALVFGNSTSVTGNAGSVSPYSFSGYHSTKVPSFGLGVSPINELLSTRLLQTQVAAQEANNRLINARADNEIARAPGISAEANEKARRWNYITSNLSDSYEAAIKAEVSYKYWQGQSAYYNAEKARDASKIMYYEAAMAEYLNTAKVPGTNFTYQQYLEQYKAMLPAATYKKVKQETLNIASQIAYRKKQGEMLDLKMIYQESVNKFAAMGRSLGNNWANTLISGLMYLWENRDGLLEPVPNEVPKTAEQRGASDPDAQ